MSDLLSFAGSVRGYKHPLVPDSPSDSVLTQRFHSHIPQLIPKGFDISPLPIEISSFVIQTLQTIESSWILNRKRPTRRMTESGDDVSHSVLKLGSTLTLSSLSYSIKKPSILPDPFSPSADWLIGARWEPFLAKVRAPWFQQLCKMLQSIWLQRSGVTSNRVPFTSREAPTSTPHHMCSSKSFR